MAGLKTWPSCSDFYPTSSKLGQSTGLGRDYAHTELLSMNGACIGLFIVSKNRSVSARTINTQHAQATDVINCDESVRDCLKFAFSKLRDELNRGYIGPAHTCRNAMNKYANYLKWIEQFFAFSGDYSEHTIMPKTVIWANTLSHCSPRVFCCCFFWVSISCST